MAINDPASIVDFCHGIIDHKPMGYCYSPRVNNLTYETRDDEVNNQFSADGVLFNSQEI